MRILIADDSVIFRERLIRLMNDIENIRSVRVAETINETVELSKTLHPDVVLLDLHMPDGSGMDIIKTIRDDSPGSVVMVCTGFPYAQYRDLSIQRGAGYFYDKNHDIEKMIRKLKEMADSEPLEKRHEGK